MTAVNHSIDVNWEIEKIGYAARDPRMDGWNCWVKKQQLYQILWATQHQLAKTPKFAGEEEWLEEQAQEQILAKLSR